MSSFHKPQHKSLSRRIAALLAFCCFFLSTLAALQHNHALGADDQDEAAVALTMALARPAPARAPHSQNMRGVPRAAAHHCPACAWQAVSVAPALALFAIPPTFRDATRFLAPLARAPSTVVARSRSRAPPVA